MYKDQLELLAFYKGGLHYFKLTMSQERTRAGEESDSDPEIDFDSAWKDKFGEEKETQEHNNDSPHVNEAQLRFE